MKSAYNKTSSANNYYYNGEETRSQQVLKEDGDIFKQKKTEARKMKHILCLKRNKNKLIIGYCLKELILIKMLMTIVLLAAMATCYGFALSVGSSALCCSSADGQLVAPRAKGNSITRLRRSSGRAAGEPQEEPARRSAVRQPAKGVELDEGSGAVPSRPPTAIKNVTAQNGQSVLLHCLVEPSGDIVVSWFRGTGELQLLTYESNTIIQDERFVVRHGLVKDDDWALQIKNLDKSTDSGLYQCQTNTQPPQSQYYQLNIVEPQVNILGAPDMAVKLGAAINLTCVISQSPDQLQFIFWYRDDRMINYDINERGKIVMSKWAQKQDTITSNLQIFNSKLSDSGNYTCMPSGARPMSIYVHVLEGLDKRLIMFQNDYDPSAASSQQTNSAISVHMVRLSRGRVYALFIAFIIFSSWFQLVAQAQTFISLLLLAIIGFFLGKVTDTPTHLPTYLDSSKSFGSNEKLAGPKTKAKPAASTIAKRRRPKKKPSSPKSSGGSNSSNEYEPHSESTSTIDPLIRRANSALNLLKTLSSASSDDGTSVQSNSDLLDTTTASASAKEKPEQKHHKEKPLTSPSASTSSASTGYNSDTRSTNLTTINSLVQRRDTLSLMLPLNQEPKVIDEADGMIELVSQPTALCLIMDEFDEGRKPRLVLRPGALVVSQAPLKPPRLEPLKLVSVDPASEPHYSSPTFAHRPATSDVSSIPSSPNLSERHTSATCDRP